MRRSYAGGAKPAKLTADLGGSTANLTIICDDLTGYPTGAAGPFYVVIDRGLAAEEKILCSSRTGNTITVYNVGLTNGRGADGTSPIAHTTNATIEHVFTAVDANEANFHVNTASLHIQANQEIIRICTSATRPVSPAVNDVILETDTSSLRYWNGTIWARVGASDDIFNAFFLIGA